MSKVFNAIAMLEILSSKRKYSIKELSEKLEVSPRTIRYYKEELEKAGFYIDSTSGKYGGYELVYDIYLPNIGVSKYDIQFLENLDNFLKDNNYKEYEYFSSFKNKVRGIYTSSQKKYKTNEVISDIDNKEKYILINDSIKNRNKLKIKYVSLEKTISERTIDPCEVFKHKDNLYLAAFCELRGEIRHFEFKRIIGICIIKDKP